MTRNQYNFKTRNSLILKFLYECHQTKDERPLMSDTDIICSNGRICVHSFVLMAVSPLLKEYIEGQYPSENEHIVVHLPDDDIETVTLVVNCFYTGHCIIPSREGVTKVYSLFKNLGVREDKLDYTVATNDESSFKYFIRAYVHVPDEEVFSLRDEEQQTEPISFNNDDQQQQVKQKKDNGDGVKRKAPRLAPGITKNKKIDKKVPASTSTTMNEKSSSSDSSSSDDDSSDKNVTAALKVPTGPGQKSRPKPGLGKIGRSKKKIGPSKHINKNSENNHQPQDTSNDGKGKVKPNVKEPKVCCPVCRKIYGQNSLYNHLQKSSCHSILTKKCDVTKKDCRTCRRRYTRMSLPEFLLHSLNCNVDDSSPRRSKPEVNNFVNLPQSPLAPFPLACDEQNRKSSVKSNMSNSDSSSSSDDDDYGVDDIEKEEMMDFRQVIIKVKRLSDAKIAQYFAKHPGQCTTTTTPITSPTKSPEKLECPKSSNQSPNKSLSETEMDQDAVVTTDEGEGSPAKSIPHPVVVEKVVPTTPSIIKPSVLTFIPSNLTSSSSSAPTTTTQTPSNLATTQPATPKPSSDALKILEILEGDDNEPEVATTSTTTTPTTTPVNATPKIAGPTPSSSTSTVTSNIVPPADNTPDVQTKRQKELAALATLFKQKIMPEIAKAQILGIKNLNKTKTPSQVPAAGSSSSSSSSMTNSVPLPPQQNIGPRPPELPTSSQTVFGSRVSPIPASTVKNTNGPAATSFAQTKVIGVPFRGPTAAVSIVKPNQVPIQGVRGVNIAFGSGQSAPPRIVAPSNWPLDRPVNHNINNNSTQQRVPNLGGWQQLTNQYNSPPVPPRIPVVNNSVLPTSASTQQAGVKKNGVILCDKCDLQFSSQRSFDDHFCMGDD